MDAQRIVNAARVYLDVPYLHQGRSVHGLDCVGLLVLPGRDCGFLPPDFDYADYGRCPTGRLDALLEKHLVPDTLRVGAVITVRWWKQSHHVGIIAEHRGDLTMIHALQQLGGVKEQRIDDRMRKRITGCWRYAGAVL